MKYSLIVLLIFIFEARQQFAWKKVFGDEEHQETLRQTFQFPRSDARFLVINNLFGSIKITGTNAEKVDFEVLKTIQAEDKAEVEKGKNRITIKFEQVGDTIFAYPDADFLCNRSRPCDCQKFDKKRDFSFRFDFEVKVPAQTDLIVSTIDKGNIEVKEVSGKLDLNNVNGAIEMQNVSNTTRAHTINGAIKAEYTHNPPKKSSFKSLNADITLHLKSELSAKCYFKSMNGELFTDFEIKDFLHSDVRTNDQENGKAIYRIEKQSGVQIGQGETEYQFETLNGNVYLKKQ